MTLFLILALYIVLTLIWLVCFFFILLMTYGLITTKVPFVPVPKYIVDAVVEMVPLRDGDVLYDLGSGDGRVIAAFAKAYPGARTVGVEKAPLPFTLTALRFFFNPRKNSKTLYTNFSKISLADATHVYMYLFPEVVEALLPKFIKELRPGAQVVTCDFPFKTRTPKDTKVITHGMGKHTLYFYEF